jgi:chromate transporter
VSWLQVLTVFLRAAFLSINGSTTLALLKQDLVDRMGILSPQAFTTGVAVGSVSPGPLGYGCIALGFMVDGWRGAIVAAVTSWLPGFLSIPLRAAYRKLEGRPWVSGLTWGVASSGTGLLVAMTASLTISSVESWKEGAVAGGALILLFLRVPAAVVLALAAALGVLFLR